MLNPRQDVYEKFDLKKVPAYAIAKALRYGITSKKSDYSRALITKFQDSINYSIASRFGLQDEKPSKETKEKYRKEVSTFTKVLEASALTLVERVIKQGWRKEAKIRFTPKVDKNTYYWKEITAEEKQINNSLFSYLMQREIKRLGTDEHIIKVCKDYDLVQEIKENLSRFNELEKLCSLALRNFLINYPIRNMHEDDQYQEGLLVVWACARNYQGRNFSRFSGMVRKGLRNKFISLLRYNIADVRKVNRIADHFTSDEGSSALAAKVDRLTYQAWDLAQREQISLDSEPNPFSTLSIDDYVGFRPDPKISLQAFNDFEDYKECDESIFPHLNEDEVVLYEVIVPEGRFQFLDGYEYEKIHHEEIDF